MTMVLKILNAHLSQDTELIMIMMMKEDNATYDERKKQWLWWWWKVFTDDSTEVNLSYEKITNVLQFNTWG